KECERECATYLMVYGELFGGGYPGTKPINVKAVQKGVFYQPDLDFYAFEISLYHDTQWESVPFDLAQQALDACGFVSARALFRGSFEDALQWSATHKADLTTLPSHYGLPDVVDNVREGHVLRPVVPARLPNGDCVILKD